jgi:hypothetical protein
MSVMTGSIQMAVWQQWSVLVILSVVLYLLLISHAVAVLSGIVHACIDF